MTQTSQKPVLYLDIDGVLLANEENLSIGAVEFIKFAAESFDVFWLTTHCMDGDPAHAVEYLSRGTKEDIKPWLKKFKPNTWSLKKTEAIDFSLPFLWYDDDCYPEEQKTLKEHNVYSSWIEVDLRIYSDQMVMS